MKVEKRQTRYPNVRWHGKVLYYRVMLANGKRPEIKYGGGSPKDASRAQQERQDEEDRIKAGLTDPRQRKIQERAARPLLDIMREYLDHMSGKDCDKGHIKNTESYLREAARVCEAKRILDLEPQRVNRWLSGLPQSARCKNARRTAVLALCRWAFNYEQTPRNPVPCGLIPKFDENADRKRLSRAMSREEAKALFETLLDPEKFSGGSDESGEPKKAARNARERRVFYILAVYTGLRWREITRLRWQDFYLYIPKPVVIVPAGQTKNGKQEELPLVATVVDALKGHRTALAVDTDHVFSGQPTLKTWKRDLARAGIITRHVEGKKETYEGYVDGRDRRLDRKCLRMSLCTWLKEAKVDLRDAQRLMRHHDPKLTSNIYTDVHWPDLRNAVESIETMDAERQAKIGQGRQSA
jgi:integrase